MLRTTHDEGKFAVPAMSNPSGPPARFSLTIREKWLAAWHEDILEPDLPIADAHHHLWERPDSRYLLPELLSDLNTGHNVVATVFVECHSMHRASGPDQMRPVGE